jgi:O-antigen/teichoic acid export membrane protein
MSSVSKFIAKIGRSSSFLVGGSLGSQLIFIAISPIITRLYTPNEFAVLNVFTSLTALFAAFSVLRLDVAIFTVSPALASSLTVLSVYIAALTSVLLSAGFYLCCAVAGISFENVDLGVLTLLLAIGLFGTALFAMITSTAVRWELYKQVGQARIFQTVIGGAVQVAAGFGGIGVVGLIAGQIISQAIGISGIWRAIVRRTRFRTVTRRLPAYFRKYIGGQFRHYALYSAPSSVVNRFSSSMVIVLYAMIYDLATVGLLALTFRAANAPMLAVARGLAQVFQKEYAKSDQFSPRQVVLIFIGALTAIGAIPSAVLAFLGPQLFGFVFGVTWEQAGVYAAILSPAFLLQFVAYPLTQSMSLSDNHRMQLTWDTIRSILLLAVFGLLHWLDVPVLGGVVALSVYLTCMYASQIIISFKLSSGFTPRTLSVASSEA